MFVNTPKNPEILFHPFPLVFLYQTYTTVLPEKRVTSTEYCINLVDSVFRNSF